MSEWFKFANGVKTYLCCVALGICGIGLKMQWMDQDTFNWFLTFLGPLTIAAIRHGQQTTTASSAAEIMDIFNNIVMKPKTEEKPDAGNHQ